MKKFSTPQSCLYLSLLIAPLLFSRTAEGQVFYSAFDQASMAYTGLSGLGMNFGAVNPAILSDLNNGHRFAFLLEATHSSARTTFKDELPDFALHLATLPRLIIALAQSKRAPISTATAFRFSRNIPIFWHPLGTLFFTYQQDWSAGIGWRLRSNLGVGLAMRHEIYTVTPTNIGRFYFGQSYRTFDFGIRQSGKRFNAGLVFRSFAKNRTSDPYTRPVLFVNLDAPSDTVVWYPMQFQDIRFSPKFFVEGGIHWLANSHWELLADISSQKEYALGLRWRVVSEFYVTTGTGKRFDRIYSDEAATYTSLGGQFQHAQYALGLTWIFSTRPGRHHDVSMPYGNFNLNQNVNNQLLITGAISF